MTTFGSEDIKFEFVEDWPHLTDEASMVEAVGVAVDSQNQVIVFTRDQVPVLQFSRDGNLLGGWGKGRFTSPHGLWIAADDTICLVDSPEHVVERFSLDGKHLGVLGTRGQPSDSGIVKLDFRTIKHAASPFNWPTNVVTDADGNFYVTDGYGNARVHRFTPSGQLSHSWGSPGGGPGEFRVPHGLGIDRDSRLYVADRENSRIQIFSSDGEYLDEWDDVVRPCEVFVATDDLVYVAEMGRQAALYSWMQPDRSAPGGRLSIFTREGNLLARWGGSPTPNPLTDFYAPHDIQVDSKGNIYMADVVQAGSHNALYESTGYPTLRKFARIS